MAGKKVKQKGITEPPQPVKSTEPAAEPFDASPLLARIDMLENGQKILNDTVAFVKDTNFLLLVVLGLGFVALIASFISGIIQATNSNTATQIEFIKTLEQVKHDVNDLRSSNRIPESTPSSNTK